MASNQTGGAAGDQPFRIEGNKVWLSAEAKYWAREWGLSDKEMARFLLSRSQQGDGYGYGVMPEEPFLPTVTAAEID